jgi:hypothetical protein
MPRGFGSLPKVNLAQAGVRPRAAADRGASGRLHSNSEPAAEAHGVHRPGKAPGAGEGCSGLHPERRRRLAAAAAAAR